MAVMEAVVSITMSHPNIVQVFTFALKPLPTLAAGLQQLQQLQQQQGMGQGADCSRGWELQLVMEYCDEGSLRQALNRGRLADPSSGDSAPALHLALALAHDVACAMLHLHSEHLIHADLKASNVLLARGTTPMLTAASSTGGSPCNATDFMSPDGLALEQQQQQQQQQQEFGPGWVGSDVSCAALLAAAQAKAGGRLIAKVADFGLSLSLDPGDTHVSHMHGGTLTHMAPELLLHGRASSASDVYAYGVLLWELLTARRAFQGVPVALLAQNVVQQRWRPGWPPGIPAPLRLLTEQCWAQEAAARPSFQQIVARLEQLMQLSPDQLHNGGALWTRALQQQQQQQQDQHQQLSLAVQTAAAPDADAEEEAVAPVDAMQQQDLQQQQQQQQQLQDGVGCAGLDLTGSWSLAMGAAAHKARTGW
ncbi:kinase-like domain-containing protein [Scenedesmus sp. NREL 46B-D3]|nr:kinase-like domain-containing protein [Scenedesmus sp. NREL 46B-D3]